MEPLLGVENLGNLRVVLLKITRRLSIVQIDQHVSQVGTQLRLRIINLLLGVPTCGAAWLAACAVMVSLLLRVRRVILFRSCSRRRRAATLNRMHRCPVRVGRVFSFFDAEGTLREVFFVTFIFLVEFLFTVVLILFVVFLFGVALFASVFTTVLSCFIKTSLDDLSNCTVVFSVCKVFLLLNDFVHSDYHRFGPVTKMVAYSLLSLTYAAAGPSREATSQAVTALHLMFAECEFFWTSPQLRALCLHQPPQM